MVGRGGITRYEREAGNREGRLGRRHCWGKGLPVAKLGKPL